ncbi:hypothetical protein MJO28_001903 [Puccinia striiformis f. sp. tritici]|uniref:G-protein coupled receptors family 1 profile domain-containing protein n=2 Tax=Puccinia striiformis f. sp. tritici TaxID=168172 RepID=A0A0L0VUF7_9BASI|nr:hypothetical protein Pst134EA_002860 [Puccinia striiformis f. sp. tritici]KAH9472238.1 hypothetical protein Pst134EA_002860 [Puccinia striiformis f. sp. tritici]KAI7961414.1 hypothetical protein MJO28_001903 [Puccinia striiformis f. sp. tritici]KAI9618190.1 hypothetical protein H4Q26_012538 [Puccinia striiformis f. sp. tritici PST-130]KNF02906.1 hypothetical protein PSTG_03853 [Puccinia striiformis f. sp. tritici PST-78]
MSVPFSTYQPAPTHLTVDRHGLLIVAGAASLSLFATLFLLLYVTVLSIVSKQKPGCTWASARLVFMQTSFGPIFLNLVFADMLLAIGLMHNFINFNERGAVTASITCTSQGVLIQLADVASALLNLLIAIETFIILSNGPMLSWYTQFSTVGIWMLSCCFAVLGFLSFSSLELHSFYNWNGAWCWISPDYLTYQITFHNVWIWLAATGLIALYGTLFSRIRTHYKGEGHILRRSSIVLPPSSPSTISSLSGSQSNTSKASKRQRVGSKGLRVVARTMLVYPISFVAYSIPLTVISLIENYRRSTLSPVVALVLSTLFALRGAIDVLAFGMTRNVFILRTPAAPAYDEEQLTPTSPHSIQKPRQISLDLDKLEDLKDSSRDPLDPRFEPQTVDLKLSLN